MKTSRQLLMFFMAALTVTPATAQEYYDITPYYIQNSDFSANVDYDRNATGALKNTLNTPQNWTADAASSAMSVIATFQYGCQATISGISVPATGPDGSENGTCLTLTNAFGEKVIFFQTAKLPPGNYQLKVTYYNCNENAEVVKENHCGWFVSSNDKVLSQTTSFGTKEWRTDVIPFTLTEVADGKLQIGVKCSGAVTKSAILAVDNVKLLRDTPYGDQDDLVPPPTVVTDMRFARGATMAFGRIKSATGENVEEQGFCWGETPEPTIYDNATTERLNKNGYIYLLKNLKPATKYYMRAYAKNSYGKVGYGETIKFFTLPKGNVTYWYNNGGDDAANTRINNAASEACDIFSNLTEMVKNFSIGYSSGTPTADCYYADDPWMNMGANASYQRTGTIMHEMQHGFGVIPYTTQWAGNILREGNGTGNWLGDRVSAFLDFWDNTTGSRLHGDTQHMWPYGINGASEDHGDVADYYANAMIGQALGEDGLEHRSNTFAEPYYAFNQEDDVKYYLKNESEDRGLYTSYLIPTNTGQLNWRAMSAAEAQQNDSTAWYITFTPSNQYYQMRNAATGQYITYSAGFKTVARTTPSNNENLHLMKGRVDVGNGNDAKRGYWIIHPTGNMTPIAMQANNNGLTGNSTFNIANSAKTQRWLILTEEEIITVENSAKEVLKEEASDLLANIKALANVPHNEIAEGTNETFAAAIAELEQRITSEDITILTSLADDALEAAKTFLSNVIAKDEPFDLTFRMKNPGMDNAEGWSVIPTVSYSCGEFYESSFDLYQTITKLPAGDYEVKMQGFQRPGTSETACNDYNAGTNKVNAMLYGGTKTQKIAHIASDAQTTNLGGTSVNGKYIPNTMATARKYFDKGLYENTLATTMAQNATSLKIGLRSSSMQTSYWVIFDNFRLYYYGYLVKGDLDRDGVITMADVSKMTEMVATGTYNAHADMNNDGKIDIADIITIIANGIDN